MLSKATDCRAEQNIMTKILSSKLVIMLERQKKKKKKKKKMFSTKDYTLKLKFGPRRSY